MCRGRNPSFDADVVVFVTNDGNWMEIVEVKVSPEYSRNLSQWTASQWPVGQWSVGQWTASQWPVGQRRWSTVNWSKEVVNGRLVKGGGQRRLSGVTSKPIKGG